MLNRYYISKGVSLEAISETEEPPVIQLECYEYVIEEGKNGWYSAKCEELNSYAQGKTWDELKSNILEAHEEMLEYV